MFYDRQGMAGRCEASLETLDCRCCLLYHPGLTIPQHTNYTTLSHSTHTSSLRTQHARTTHGVTRVFGG